MRVKTYRVAGLDFRVEFPDEVEPARMQNYEPFAIDGGGDVMFTLRFCDSLSSGGMRRVRLQETANPMEPRIDMYSAPDGGSLFELYPTYRSPMAGRVLLSSDYSEALLDSTGTFAINNALMIAYALRGAREGVLEMHSSTVVHEGLAYMFLGVSGTGKSTHSRLWMENIPGTWLLNDDNPVIRVTDGAVRVYGTPWSGKTPCYKNDSAPVGAIVNLHQAPRNVIRRQTLLEGYAAIFSSCSGLKSEGTFIDLLHGSISSVLSSVPCFDLDCLPDADAALTCHAAVAPKAPMASREIPNEILLPEVENLLSCGKDVVLLTKGNSMLPTIRGGADSVRLRRSDRYTVGDVVLAEIGHRQYVLHRILSMDTSGVVLKGDGNLRGTEKCRVEDICGRAVALVRGDRERPVGSSALWRSLPYLIKRVLLSIIVRL